MAIGIVRRLSEWWHRPSFAEIVKLKNDLIEAKAAFLSGLPYGFSMQISRAFDQLRESQARLTEDTRIVLEDMKKKIKDSAFDVQRFSSNLNNVNSTLIAMMRDRNAKVDQAMSLTSEHLALSDKFQGGLRTMILRSCSEADALKRRILKLEKVRKAKRKSR